ncbi:MAG: SLATT domain-containing protein [Mycobacterium sp.]
MSDDTNITSVEKSRLEAEAARIEESAMYSAQGQFEAAKVWQQVHWALGCSMTGGSAMAGILAFASGTLQILSGSLAVLSALAGAIITTLRPDRKAQKAVLNANNYLRIQGSARRCRNLRAHTFNSVQDGSAEVERIANNIADINTAAEPIPRLAYRRARRNILRDMGQTFSGDRE